MDPQAPVQPANIPVPPPPKPFPLLLVLLSILAYLLLITTGYLAYRNVQLRKELTTLQTIPSSTPPPIPSTTIEASPSATPIAGEGQFCGGIAGKVCPEGYSCTYDGNYPDASGVCIKGTEKIPAISTAELEMGWYYGTKNQKKPSTPASWIYTEAGRSSCWHIPNTQCGYLPD